MPEFVSAVALVVPGLLYLVAAGWALSRRGLVMALVATLITCGLLVIGMMYEYGPEFALLIYGVSAIALGASLVFGSRKSTDLKGA